MVLPTVVDVSAGVDAIPPVISNNPAAVVGLPSPTVVDVSAGLNLHAALVDIRPTAEDELRMVAVNLPTAVDTHPAVIDTHPSAAIDLLLAVDLSVAGSNHPTAVDTISHIAVDHSFPVDTNRVKGKRKGKPACVKRNAKRKCVQKSCQRLNQDDHEMCRGCGYEYGDSDDPLIGDMWKTCSICKQWFHESCGLLCKQKFICNECAQR